MNVTQNTENKTTVKLSIELLDEEMKPYLEKAAARISKEVKMDGFRPGKAPYDVVKQKIGEMEIYQEAVKDAVDDVLPKAVKNEKIDFVGQPQVDVEKVVPGSGLTFTATFALMPEVVLKDYTTVKVKREVSKVDDKKLKNTMDDLRRMQAKTKVVDRVAKTGDQVQIDFNITLAGVPIEGGQGSKVPMTIGDGQFIPGFEEQLVGMKKGEEKIFQLKFPKDYAAKHLAGKECDFKVNVHDVFEVELPELNDEFAKMMNFTSLKELEEKILENVKLEMEQSADQKFENDVIEAVIKQSTFDPIPQLLVDSELDRMWDELRQQVEERGGKMEEYLQHLEKTEEELRTTWQEQAEGRVKAALVIKAVGEKENIKVEETEIEAQVEKYKTIYKDQPEQLAQFESLEFRAYTRSMLRNQRVVEKLKDFAEGKKSADKNTEKNSDAASSSGIISTSTDVNAAKKDA